MIEILNRFLVQNRSISIPGLGTLHAERVPARKNQESTALLPPCYNFKFDKYFDAPDKAFFQYLSALQHVPEYESMRLYNQFAQDFRSAIMLEEKSEWPGIGYFKKNSAGEVEFVQTVVSHAGYEPVEWKAVAVRKTSIEPVDLQASAGNEYQVETGSFAEPALLVPVGTAVQAASTSLVRVVTAAQAEFTLPAPEENVLNVESTTPVSSEFPPQAELQQLHQPQEASLSGAELATEVIPVEDTSFSEPVSTSQKVLIRIGWGAVAAAAIALFIHFSQHGFNLKAAANQQSVHTSR